MNLHLRLAPSPSSFDPPVAGFSTLTRSQQVQVTIGTAIVLGLGQLFFPTWFISVLIASTLIGIAIGVGAFSSLILFIVVCVGLSAKPTHDYTQIGVFEVVGGLVIFGLSVYWPIRLWLIERKHVLKDKLFILYAVFLGWTSGVGLLQVALGATTVNNWMREMMLFLPVFIIPILFVESVDARSKNQATLFKLCIVLWGASMFYNFFQYRQNIVRAYYLYETGRAAFGSDSTIYFLLLCISCVMFLCKPRIVLFLIIGIVLGLVSIGISAFRTNYVATIAAIPVIVALGKSNERRLGLKRLMIALGVAIAAIVIVSMLYPLVGLLAQGFLNRFVSTRNVKTDISLLNRFIESRYDLIALRESPILGLGFGGSWRVFDWIKRIHFWPGYTHNGYLYVLLKAGIPGFVCFFTVWIAFFLRTIKLARLKILSPFERALFRSSAGFQFASFIMTYTLNVYAIRPIWIGLTWGLVLTYEAYLSKTSLNAHSHTL